MHVNAGPAGRDAPLRECGERSGFGNDEGLRLGLSCDQTEPAIRGLVCIRRKRRRSGVGFVDVHRPFKFVFIDACEMTYVLFSQIHQTPKNINVSNILVNSHCYK